MGIEWHVDLSGRTESPSQYLLVLLAAVDSWSVEARSIHQVCTDSHARGCYESVNLDTCIGQNGRHANSEHCDS